MSPSLGGQGDGMDESVKEVQQTTSTIARLLGGGGAQEDATGGGGVGLGEGASGRSALSKFRSGATAVVAAQRFGGGETNVAERSGSFDNEGESLGSRGRSYTQGYNQVGARTNKQTNK